MQSWLDAGTPDQRRQYLARKYARLWAEKCGLVLTQGAPMQQAWLKRLLLWCVAFSPHSPPTHTHTQLPPFCTDAKLKAYPKPTHSVLDFAR
jgi:hypothetical protein